ncbi:MAG TPA: phytoene/squalene synthase family protein [Phycisphaerales bacterium]|nr:phytoene/squalene synthase family protein [Phycisphaerales bacterium]HMP36479.1 phytoene/squalene synthase family protein [Phycisphaerales bacterium]
MKPPLSEEPLGAMDAGATAPRTLGEISPSELAAAYGICEAITRRRARNFYYGMKLTPAPKRAAMYAVYAWMREADDLADAGAPTGAGAGPAAEREVVDAAERIRRIEALRVRTRRLFAGELPPTGAAHSASVATWIAMADTVRRHRLSIEPFLEMLDGQREDVEGRVYATFSELRGFCHRVASTVGLVCISIWGYEDDRAVGLAIERGVAFQLTNILRDFREDHERGRVYLPTEDFERHGLAPATLAAWADPDRCRSFMLEQIDRAKERYAASSALDELVEAECRPTLWAMTRIYRGLLDRIEADPSQIAGRRRIRLSSFVKASIALRARIAAALGGGFGTGSVAGGPPPSTGGRAPQADLTPSGAGRRAVERSVR